MIINQSQAGHELSLEKETEEAFEKMPFKHSCEHLVNKLMLCPR